MGGNFLPTVDEDTFYLFKSAKGAGNCVIPSLDVGIEAIAIRIISFRCLSRLLVSNFRHP